MHWYNLKKSICNAIGINIDMVKWLKKQGVVIGEQCEIFQHVDFGSEPYMIQLGNKVRVTNGVKFFTHEGGVHVIRNLIPGCEDIDKFGEIIVGDNVHIGANAMIMPGIRIGKNCIIGAGAIVTHDVPDNSVAVGVPAKIVCSIDEFYEKNKTQFVNTKNLNEREKKKYILEKL